MNKIQNTKSIYSRIVISWVVFFFGFFTIISINSTDLNLLTKFLYAFFATGIYVFLTILLKKEKK